MERSIHSYTKVELIDKVKELQDQVEELEAAEEDYSETNILHPKSLCDELKLEIVIKLYSLDLEDLQVLEKRYGLEFS